jgi:hypothetical protein
MDNIPYTPVEDRHGLPTLFVSIATSIPKYFLGFEAFTAVVMKSIIFWDVTPCSLLSCNRRFGGTYRLHLQGRKNNFCFPPAYLLFLAEIISSTLKMEVICSSETSVVTQQGYTASHPRR